MTVRTLDRYLLREIAGPFLAGLGLFFVVVAFGELLKISDSVTGLGVGPSDVFRALLYSVPPVLGLLLPVCALFATLLAIGRLASDRELRALAAAGVSPYRLLSVPLAVGLVLAACAAVALLYGEPWGIRGVKEVLARGAQRALTEGVQVGEFTEWVDGVTFIARGREGDKLANIVFADQREEDRPVVVSARRGRIRAGVTARDIVFDLEDGAMLLYRRGSADLRRLEFATGQYHLDVGKLVSGKLFNVTAAQSMGPLELWRESRDPSHSRDRAGLFTITLHRKLALPLATIVFALLAVPLASRATSAARARGFLLSAGIVGAYYYIGRAFELAARSGRFPVELAAWMPLLLGGLVLLPMLWRLRRAA